MTSHASMQARASEQACMNKYGQAMRACESMREHARARFRFGILTESTIQDKISLLNKRTLDF